MVYSEATQILARPLILAAGILGTVEGLSWTILSIISICFYTDAITISNLSPYSYGYWIYAIFLTSTQIGQNDFIVTPQAFNICMYFYLVLSFIWLILSLFLIWIMIRGKWSKCFNLTISWIVVAATVAVFDIILMSLIAADLNKFNSESNFSDVTSPEITTEATTTTIAAEEINGRIQLQQVITEIDTAINIQQALKAIASGSYAIVMTLAAKGYLLWICNVVFVVALCFIAIKMHKENRPSLLPFIDAYATGPPPSHQFELSNGNINEGYQHDDSGIFSRGQSLAYPYNKGNNQRLPNNPLANNYNNTSTLPVRQSVESNFSFSKPIDKKDPPKVAKIGKFGGGKKSPSQHIPPPNVPPLNGPYIPEPDYSPPGTPKVKPTKGVLRPKSNYVL